MQVLKRIVRQPNSICAFGTLVFLFVLLIGLSWQSTQAQSSGSISGVVSDKDGAPLGSIQVELYSRFQDGSFVMWRQEQSAFSNIEGGYTFTGLSAGVYHLRFMDTRPIPYYFTKIYNNDAGAIEEGTDIPLAENQSIDHIDVQLSAAPRITGHVYNAMGAPLSNIDVIPHLFADNGVGGYWAIGNGTMTDIEGYYAVALPWAGEIRLQFGSGTYTSAYATEYYDDAHLLENATTLTVAADEVINDINAHLEHNGAITGMIADEQGSPLSGIAWVISSFEPTTGSWQQAANGITGPDGLYVTHLEVGSYRMNFYDNSQPARYAPEFYENVATIEAATDVTVTNGVTTTINASLAQTGAIQGRVTDAEGNAIVNATVTFYEYGLNINNGDEGWFAQVNATTNENGLYEVTGLIPGTYRVGFSVYGEPIHYVAEFYADSSTVDEAQDIIVESAQTVTGIDAVLDRAGVISGRVTNQSGEGLPNIQVRVWRMATEGDWAEQAWVSTDSNGDYRVNDLQAGLYRLGFVDMNYPGVYAAEYYNDVEGLAAASDISVVLNTVNSGIDALLSPRSTITGRVADGENNPIATIAINAYKFMTDGPYSGTWQVVGSATTGEDGLYALSGIEQGAYRLQFVEDSSRNLYLDEYYDNVYTLEEATTITVGRSIMVAGINIGLSMGGSISGQISDADENPVSGVSASAFVAQESETGTIWTPIGVTGISDEQGDYVIAQLAPGTYRVCFYDNQGILVSECYADQLTVEAGNDIQVLADTNTPGIDAQLAQASTISGHLSDPLGEAAVNVDVTAFRMLDEESGWQPVAYAQSDTEGNYRLGVGIAGLYRVGFGVTDLGTIGQYVPEYYADASTIEAAQDIAVADNENIDQIDAQLDRYGAISGIVTDESSNPLNAAVWLSRQIGEDSESYWLTTQYASTDADGAYQFENVPPGLYRVGFGGGSPIQYRDEYYDNVRRFEEATTITVTANLVIENIDAQLASFEGDSAPVVEDDALFVVRGQSATLLASGATSVFANDSDAEDDPMTASLVDYPTHGAVTLNADGTFIYTHSGDDALADSFSYQAYDGLLTSEVATVQITVRPEPLAPIATADFIKVMRSGRATSLLSGSDSLLTNDSGLNGVPITATLVSTPTYGTLTLNADGSFVYQHGDAQSTSDSFTYTASDLFAESIPVTVSIAITATGSGTTTLPPTPTMGFEFTKTVGIEGLTPMCGGVSTMQVPISTTIVYCYTIHNTGAVTLTTHSLVDSHLGQILDNVAYELVPGASYTTTVTQTLTVSTTNVATWTASIASPDPVRLTQPGASSLSTTSATIQISSATDDQDNDTIPDNVESANDVDEDNLPNFFDMDSDNDGISDKEEAGSDPTNPQDVNDNGTPDYLEPDATAQTSYRLWLPVAFE